MLIPVLCKCIYKYLQTLNHEVQIVLLLFVCVCFFETRVKGKNNSVLCLSTTSKFRFTSR